MAQIGYTPILIYSSSTAAAAPAAGSLTNSTLGSELAINITDGKLFYKDNANAVQVIGWKVVPTSAGGTGLTSYSQGDIIYYNSGTTFTALGKNTTATRYLSNTGTNNNPAWAQIDLTNGVTGILPSANGGTGVANSFNITVGGALTTASSFTTSGAFAMTLTATASTNVTLPTTGTLATLAGTETFTNKNIQSRVVAIADGTSVTINADTTDVATQANTQGAGTLTINAPTGTPFNGQKLIFRLSSTSVQTFSWNGVFQGSTDLNLPTASSSGGKFDYVGFIYNSTATKWQLVAKVFGF